MIIRKAPPHFYASQQIKIRYCSPQIRPDRSPKHQMLICSRIQYSIIAGDNALLYLYLCMPLPLTVLLPAKKQPTQLTVISQQAFGCFFHSITFQIFILQYLLPQQFL